MITHVIYIDRRPDSIDGLMSIHREIAPGQVEVVYKQIPIRSGQKGYTKTDWERGKSPIPYGNHWLITSPKPLQMEPRGTRFFPICTDIADQRLIVGANGNVRWDIGLHRENQYPGSAGCVVIVDKAKAEDIFNYLEKLKKTEPFIRIKVL